ncbi:MAG: fibronectin type III domain-containing protein [Bacteroidia bacterium]|nr:fibronectin type III domain-containing protein [Bacteroidia bacterium]
MKKTILTLLLPLTCFLSIAQFGVKNNGGIGQAVHTSASSGSFYGYLPSGNYLLAINQTMVSSTLYYQFDLPGSSSANSGYSCGGFVGSCGFLPECNKEVIVVSNAKGFVRENAGTSQAILSFGGNSIYVFPGQKYCKIGGPQKADGYDWYQIALPNGYTRTTGWVANAPGVGATLSITSSTTSGTIIAPTLSSASSITDKTAYVSWTANNGLNTSYVTYDIYVNSSFYNNVNTTNTTISGLSASSSYQVYVIAKNSSGCLSVKSNTINFSTAGGSLTAPTNFKVSNNSPTSLRLTWDASTGASSYDIWQNCNSSSKINTTNTYYDFTGLTPGQTYGYLVEAKNATSKAATSCENATLPDYPPNLSSPANGANGIAVSNVKFSWSNSLTNPVLYNFQLSENSNFTSIIYEELTSNTSCTLSSSITLTGNKTYYWRVASAIAASSIGNYSTYYLFNTTNSTSTITISGYVRDASSNGISGVQIDDGILNVASTNSSGFYSFQVTKPYSKTITPAKSGYTFSPSNKPFSNVSTDQTQINFTGSASSSPSLTLLSPKGGEVWNEGSTQKILWSSNSISKIKIEYSLNGSTWNSINSSVTASLGSYSWKIPVLGVKETNCYVKITEVGESLSDINNSAFTISPLPTFWMSISTIHKDEKGKMVTSELTKGTSIQSQNSLLQPAKICADGSKVTRIDFNCDDISYDLKNVRFRIASSNDKDMSGYFDMSDYNINSSLLSVFYTHPTFMDDNNYHRVDTIIAYDNKSQMRLHTFPILVYRAPVLFVHGWIGAPSAFDIMEYQVKQIPYLILKADYSNSNGASFYQNRYIVSMEIRKLLDNAFKMGFSTGRVSIVAHSMGGILSRLYIQSTFVPYQNDVERLITLNTPHSGTQIANMFYKVGDFLTDNGFLGYGKGATKDMCVDLDGIRSYLNGATKSNGSKVPSHPLATVFTDTKLDMSDKFMNNIRLLAKLWGKSLAEVMAAAFLTERSDIVVPLNSQLGGLYNFNNREIEGQFHMGSAENEKVYSKVSLLLKQNPKNSSYFSQIGFNPPIYTYKHLLKKKDDTFEFHIVDGSLKILSLTPSKRVYSGQEITVIAETSSAINNTACMFLDQDNTLIENKNGNGIVTFKYTIPLDIADKLKIIVFGFNEDGLVDYDTAIIDIEIPTDVKLDSIYTIPDKLYLYQNTTETFKVYGNYSDGIARLINNFNQMEITELNPNIAEFVSEGYVKGLSIDTSSVRIWHLGKTTYLKVKVLEPIGSTLDIKEQEINSQNNLNIKSLKIFPNPNKGEFTIEFNTGIGDLVAIEVYNGLGQRVFISKEKASEYIFSQTLLLNSMPDGIYYVKATSSRGNYSGKVIISK